MAAATIQNHQELIIGPAPDMVRSPHGKLERGRHHAKHAGNCLCPRCSPEKPQSLSASSAERRKAPAAPQGFRQMGLHDGAAVNAGDLIRVARVLRALFARFSFFMSVASFEALLPADNDPMLI